MMSQPVSQASSDAVVSQFPGLIQSQNYHETQRAMTRALDRAVPTFSGEPGSKVRWAPWHAQLKLWLASHLGMDLEHPDVVSKARLLALSKTTGPANQWMVNLFQNATKQPQLAARISTFSGLMQAMNEQYHDPQRALEARTALYQMRIKPGEHLPSVFVRVFELMEEADASEAERMVQLQSMLADYPEALNMLAYLSADATKAGRTISAREVVGTLTTVLRTKPSAVATLTSLTSSPHASTSAAAPVADVSALADAMSAALTRMGFERRDSRKSSSTPERGRSQERRQWNDRGRSRSRQRSPDPRTWPGWPDRHVVSDKEIENRREARACFICGAADHSMTTCKQRKQGSTPNGSRSPSPDPKDQRPRATDRR